MASLDTIWFLSDYGLKDEFVGVVKGVVQSIAPGTLVVDLNHGIEPFDIRGASLSLARSLQYLTPGVALAVVDPGVGTDRRAIAVEVGGDDGPFAYLVGPDNGLLAPAVAMAGGARRAVSLTNADYHLPSPGPTFAGRDIMGPAAAHLCAGVELDQLGDPVEPVSLRPGLVPLPFTEDDGSANAEVLWVDRFGNAQLNVGPDEVAGLGAQVKLTIEGTTRVAHRVQTFDDLKTGQLGVLVDSYGLMCLVAARRSAAEELKLHAGSAVRLEHPED